MIGLNNTIIFYIAITILLTNIVFSTNHVNSLVLFFINTFIYYIYCYSINCNWVSLIILLWYARRISVLFYLLACYSSSLTYSNVYNYTPYYVGKINKFKSTLYGYIEAGLVTKLLCKTIFALFYYPYYDSKTTINYIEMKNYLTQRQYHNVFNSYSSNKPIILKWTKFVDIYSSIVSTPSVLFLVAFLLPVFAYLIYFICNNLSYRK